jgi:zinc transport system permease protein
VSAFPEAIWQYQFMQNALAAGVLAGIGCGLAGTYVVARRLGFVAGGIAHGVLGGMGAAVYAGQSPLLGALVAALAAALLIGWINRAWREREDTLIGAVWAMGMAAGILFLAATPGYQTDLLSFLFGNILMVSAVDLKMMVTLDLLLLAGVGLFYRQFEALVFDEEFASLRGVPVTFFYLLLLCLVAVSVVLLIRVVGLILVIALLTLPAAIAGHYVRTLGAMMLVAVVLGTGFNVGGLALSYAMDLPSGAVIILILGFGYLLSAALKSARARRRAMRAVMGTREHGDTAAD